MQWLQRSRRKSKRWAPPPSVSLAEKPMLAKASAPFHRDGWVYEIKYDGYRLLIERRGDDVTLHSRTGIDLTSRFPEVVKAARRLPCSEFLIDSEVVVHDRRGVPSFPLLQERAAVRGDRATSLAARHNPVTCYAFDLPHAAGFDLKGQPLLERKRLLEVLLPAAGPIRYSAHIEGNGVETFERMTGLGLEGHRRQEGGLDVPQRSPRQLAEGARQSHGRLRHRRLGAAEVECR